MLVSLISAVIITTPPGLQSFRRFITGIVGPSNIASTPLRVTTSYNRPSLFVAAERSSSKILLLEALSLPRLASCWIHLPSKTCGFFQALGRGETKARQWRILHLLCPARPLLRARPKCAVQLAYVFLLAYGTCLLAGKYYRRRVFGLWAILVRSSCENCASNVAIVLRCGRCSSEWCVLIRVQSFIYGNMVYGGWQCICSTLA